MTTIDDSLYGDLQRILAGLKAGSKIQTGVKEEDGQLWPVIITASATHRWPMPQPTHAAGRLLVEQCAADLLELIGRELARRGAKVSRA